MTTYVILDNTDNTARPWSVVLPDGTILQYASVCEMVTEVAAMPHLPAYGTTLVQRGFAATVANLLASAELDTLNRS